MDSVPISGEVLYTYCENYYQISLKPLVTGEDTADEADHGTRTGLWCEDLRTRDRGPGGCGRLREVGAGDGTGTGHRTPMGQLATAPVTHWRRPHPPAVTVTRTGIVMYGGGGISFRSEIFGFDNIPKNLRKCSNTSIQT